MSQIRSTGNGDLDLSLMNLKGSSSSRPATVRRSGSAAVRRNSSNAVRRNEAATARRQRSGYYSSSQRFREGTYRGKGVRLASRPVIRPGAMQKRRLYRQQQLRKKLLMLAVEVLALICVALTVFLMVSSTGKTQDLQTASIPLSREGSDVQEVHTEELIQGVSAQIYAKHPDWTEDFLTPNEYSRPGDPLTQVNNIFVHYTANPGTSAAQNRSYFEQQKDTHEASVSAHFIIGYEGEILQIVPLDEIAYAVMTRNEDSISIECCYKAENGQFTQETYDSLIGLLSWLTEAYGLDSEDILRHYDCGGKKCPLYYVEHEDAWEQLKRDVANYTL